LKEAADMWNDPNFAPPFRKKKIKVVKKDEKEKKKGKKEKGAEGKSYFIIKMSTWHRIIMIFGIFMTFIMTSFTYNFFFTVFEGDSILKHEMDREWELEKLKTNRTV